MIGLGLVILLIGGSIMCTMLAIGPGSKARSVIFWSGITLYGVGLAISVAAAMGSIYR